MTRRTKTSTVGIFVFPTVD